MLEAKNWIKKVYWEDVRDQVAAVNPEFAAEVDKLSPGKDLPLYLAQYRFGESILKDGMLQLPDQRGHLVARTDPELGKEMNEAFSYVLSMPIGMILKNQFEIHRLEKSIPLSFRAVTPGAIFGLWGLLDKINSSHAGGKMWQITSGSRSICMLPKISDERDFKRLAKFFELKTKQIPEKLAEQWPLFVELANSPIFSKTWHSEMLFFSKEWYQKIDDPAWMELKFFLHKKAWIDTTWFRDQFIFDFSFSSALKAFNLRPNPYLADIVKYLYHISYGVYPAFKIATDDSAAPVSQFQEIFTNIYHLESAPLMAHFASMKSLEKESALYYSLELPIQATFSPRSSQATNKLADLREIKHIQETTQKYFLQDELSLAGLPLYNIMADSKFEYFHINEDNREGILCSNFMPKIDINISNELKKFLNKKFCSSSPFFCGCIRILKR